MKRTNKKEDLTYNLQQHYFLDSKHFLFLFSDGYWPFLIIFLLFSDGYWPLVFDWTFDECRSRDPSRIPVCGTCRTQQKKSSDSRTRLFPDLFYSWMWSEWILHRPSVYPSFTEVYGWCFTVLQREHFFNIFWSIRFRIAQKYWKECFLVTLSSKWGMNICED